MDDTTTETTPTPPNRSLTHRLLPVLLWIIVAAAVIFLTKGFWYHPSAQPKPAAGKTVHTAKLNTLLKDDVRDLNQRLNEVEQNIAATKATATTPTPPIDTSAMEAQIASLTTLVTALEKQVSSLTEKINTTPAITTTAPTTTSTVSMAHEKDFFALVIAQQLSRKLMLDRDLTKEIDMLKKTDDAAIQPKVAVLTALDADGIPTLSYLKSSFAKNISAVLSADTKKTKGTVGTVASKLQSIVTVRRIGDNVEGNDTDAIIARAETAIANNDIKQARDELKALPDNLQAILQPWASEADKRIEAENAVESILDDLSARVIPTTKTTGPAS